MNNKVAAFERALWPIQSAKSPRGSPASSAQTNGMLPVCHQCLMCNCTSATFQLWDKNYAVGSSHNPWPRRGPTITIKKGALRIGWLDMTRSSFIQLDQIPQTKYWPGLIALPLPSPRSDGVLRQVASNPGLQLLLYIYVFCWTSRGLVGTQSWLPLQLARL